MTDDNIASYSSRPLRQPAYYERQNDTHDPWSPNTSCKITAAARCGGVECCPTVMPGLSGDETKKH